MSGAEILYLHPAPRGEAYRDGASYPVLPVGAVAHMNHLTRFGFSVTGLNAPAQRSQDFAFSLADWARGQPAPALVLLDLHWVEHARGALEAARLARAAWPEARIALGGLTATRFAAEALALCPALDAVVTGDAEEAVAALARAAVDRAPWPPDAPNLLARAPGGLWQSPRRAATRQADFDQSDTASLDWLIDAPVYRRLLHSRPPRALSRPGDQGHWIANGRGCAFDCLYCGGGRSAHQALSGLKGVLRRDPAVVAAEVDRLHAAGVAQVALTLDPDMLGARHQAAFFAALQARPGLYVESFQLPSPALRAALCDRADLEHSELALTPLSGDEGVRRRNGKRYSNAALLDAVAELGARGVSVFAFFSLNLPGEDEATLTQTLALAEALLEAAPPGRLRVANICHTLDPASPLAESPEGWGATAAMRCLADFVALAEQPRPWRFEEGERGFGMPGRDLAAMVARWDAFCAGRETLAIPVPRG